MLNWEFCESRDMGALPRFHLRRTEVNPVRLRARGASRLRRVPVVVAGFAAAAGHILTLR